MIAKSLRRGPPPSVSLEQVDEAVLAAVRAGFDAVGDLVGRHRQRAAIAEAMRVVGEVNKYVTATEPYKMKGDGERARLGTVLHVAAQCVLDCNTMLSPFLPHSSTKVWQALGGKGEFQPMPRIEYVEELDPDQGRAADLPGDHRRVLADAALGVPAGDRRRHGREADADLHRSTPPWSRRSAPGWPRREGAGGRRLGLGSAVVAALGDRHEVVAASRSGERFVDLTNSASIAGLYASVGQVDAVVCTAGKTPYGRWPSLSSDQWLAGVRDNLLGQVELVRLGLPHVADGGSFTLVSGILSVEPVLTGAVASTVDGGIDAFVRSAAIEPPAASASTRSARRSSRRRGRLRLDVRRRHADPVAEAAQAYVEAIEGDATGQVLRVGY